MEAYPLQRCRFSNEHASAAVFGVLLLYLLPQWLKSPGDIPRFLLVLALALLLDAGINFIRYRQPVCAVSAAVSASMLYVLTVSVPLWGQVLGVFAALLIGKHLWGGTGRNIFNPAVTGFVLLSFFWPQSFPLFEYSPWLIPAIIFSLLFIQYRPYASLGFLIGMSLWMVAAQQFSMEGFIGYGVVFWACLTVTDPVTVTLHPLYGGLAGLAGGFLPLWIYPSPIAPAVGVLFINGCTAVLDGFGYILPAFMYLPMKIRKAVPPAKESDFVDLAADAADPQPGSVTLTADIILDRIRKNEVYGLGGGGYSTIQKIMTVKESDARDKHLLINGVECDPGLIHDQWLLKHHPEEIWRGISLLLKCMGFATITLAVKQVPDNRPPKPVQVKQIADHYPAGAERNLIQEILGRRLGHDEIPAAAGILVLNVQTVHAVYEAVMRNKRADTRLITVADLVSGTSRVVKIRHGMTVGEVMEAVYPNASRVYWGGGLMQARMANQEDIVDKSVNFIAAATHPKYKESRLCSSCGSCVLYCPAHIQVAKVAACVDQDKMEDALPYHPEHCMQCGSCSYVCMAGRNLTARVNRAKDYVRCSSLK